MSIAVRPRVSSRFKYAASGAGANVEKNVVGAANATAAGWGNLGGGVTNALTPVVFNIMMAATNKNIDLAWRLTFLLPLAMHLITSLIVLSGRDLPDGDFKELEQSGAK